VELLSQSVVLGGIESATFGRSINSLYEAYTVFERRFEEGKIEPFDMIKQGDQGIELTISNRY
jgi:hypothetical protein